MRGPNNLERFTSTNRTFVKDTIVKPKYNIGCETDNRGVKGDFPYNRHFEKIL